MVQDVYHKGVWRLQQVSPLLLGRALMKCSRDKWILPAEMWGQTSLRRMTIIDWKYKCDSHHCWMFIPCQTMTVCLGWDRARVVFLISLPYLWMMILTAVICRRLGIFTQFKIMVEGFDHRMLAPWWYFSLISQKCGFWYITLTNVKVHILCYHIHTLTHIDTHTHTILTGA